MEKQAEIPWELKDFRQLPAKMSLVEISEAISDEGRRKQRYWSGVSDVFEAARVEVWKRKPRQWK